MADLKISALTSATTPLAGTEVLPLVQSGTTKKVAVSDLTAGRTVTLGQGVISRNMSSGNWLVLDDSRVGFGDWAFYKAGSNDLTFGYDTTGGSAPVSAVTFEYGGNVKVLTGNLAFSTSGKGIDFSATAGTGTSELLADYEEGTWTPVLARTTGGAITGTYNTQNGKYTKIGNLVTVSAYIDIASISAQGSAESTVLGLPYAPVDNAVWNGAVTRNTAFLVDIATTCSQWSDGRVLFHAPLNTLSFLSNGWTAGVVSFTLTYRV